MYYPEVKYYLTTELSGRVLLGSPPIGWNEDNKELVRSTQYWGVFTQLSNSLEFVKDAAQILTATYESLGTETEVTLERFVLSSMDEGYELDYIGQLDLKTYAVENDKVKVEFLTGGLQSLIESQFNEKYEIQRQTDIDGNAISEVDLKRVFWEGRKIFLQTYYETSEDAETFPEPFTDPTSGNPVAPLFYTTGFDNNRYTVVTLPATIIAESDLQYQDTTDVKRWFVESFGIFPTTPDPMGFCLFADRDFDVNIKVSYKTKLTFATTDTSSTGWNLASVRAFVYKYSENPSTQELEYVSRQAITNTAISLVNGTTTFPLDYEVTNGETNVSMQAGDVIAIGLGIVMIQGSYLEISLDDILDVDIKFSEDSEFPASEFNAIRTHDLGERLMEIITGKKRLFKSEFFGKQSDGYPENSLFENTAITSGEVIRQQPDGKITTTIKDLYELNNYFNLGWGIERTGKFEQLVIEPKEYFFRNQVGIELGEVSDFKISVADDFLYKSLAFGNDKAGDYEEVQGRSEYNVYNTFVSPLKTADEEYDVSGKIRADLIGAELARRKQFSNSPNEDTEYDKQVFILQTKQGQDDLLNLRTWQDDLSEEPIVYDPPTAGNLLLTPFRSMQRHASFFKCGMVPYSLKFIRYASTTGNSEVGTKIGNNPVRFENSDIELKDLKPAIFKAEYYEFSFPTTHKIRKRLMEKIGNIPVPYFLVKFTFREQEYSGWIINVSLNNEGNWKLIKNYK